MGDMALGAAAGLLVAALVGLWIIWIVVKRMWK